MQFGQQEETISICPFPLKTQMMHTEIPEKQQARKNLGLQDRFTVLLNLGGGEGIGTTDFLEEVQKKETLIGKLSQSEHSVAARNYITSVFVRNSHLFLFLLPVLLTISRTISVRAMSKLERQGQMP